MLPAVRIKDNMDLDPGEYSLQIQGLEVARETMLPRKLMAFSPECRPLTIIGQDARAQRPSGHRRPGRHQRPAIAAGLAQVVVAAQEQHGQRLSFYGGMSIQKVMPFGTPDEVRNEARRLMSVLGRGGGYILAPSHDMPGDIPVENIVALIETVQNQ